MPEVATTTVAQDGVTASCARCGHGIEFVVDRDLDDVMDPAGFGEWYRLDGPGDGTVCAPGPDDADRGHDPTDPDGT